MLGDSTLDYVKYEGVALDAEYIDIKSGDIIKWIMDKDSIVFAKWQNLSTIDNLEATLDLTKCGSCNRLKLI